MKKRDFKDGRKGRIHTSIIKQFKIRDTLGEGELSPNIIKEREKVTAKVSRDI